GGLAAVVGAAQPLVVIALAWAMEGKRPVALALIASVAGIAGMGILLLSPQSRWDAWGMAAAILGALCMACGTYLSRRWRSGLPVLAFTGWQLLLGGGGAGAMAAAVRGVRGMTCGSFLSRRWRGGLPVLAFTGWQLLLGGLRLAPLALWVDPPLDSSLTWSQAGGYAYLCLAGALLPLALALTGAAVQARAAPPATVTARRRADTSRAWPELRPASTST